MIGGTKKFGVSALLLFLLLAGWQWASQACGQGCQRGSGGGTTSMRGYPTGAAFGYPTGQQASAQRYADPYAAAAAAMNAQGRLMVNQMQAFLIQEQVRSARISNRRAQFDEMRYQSSNTPTAQQDRQRLFAQQLLRSLNNPPLTEIWSGQALNVLLVDLSQTPDNRSTARLSTFTLPLDEVDLGSIHVMAAGRTGSVAIFQNSGELQWPLALTSQSLKDSRDRVAQSVQQTVQDLKRGQNPDPAVIGRLANDVEQLQTQLKRDAGAVSCSQYRDANVFLNRLRDDARALQAQAQTGNSFNGKHALAEVKTVPELVRRMAGTGLTFAPAGPGEQASYKALHQALVAYDRELHPTK